MMLEDTVDQWKYIDKVNVAYKIPVALDPADRHPLDLNIAV